METSDRGVLDVERFDLEPDRPLFHGLLAGLRSSDLAGLSLQQKAPYVLRILGASDVSSRGAASLLEVGETITGWPQLGSEVTLGAATAAAAVRRLGQKADLPSGRVRFDVEEVLAGIAPLGPDRARTRVRARTFAVVRRLDPPPAIGAPIRSRSSSTRRGEPPRAEISSPGGSRPMRTRSACTWFPSARPPWTCGTGAATWPSAPRFQRTGGRRIAEEPGGVPALPRGVTLPPRGDAAGGCVDRLRDRPLEPRVRARSANRQMGDASPIDERDRRRCSPGPWQREGSQLRLTSSRDQIADMAALLGESDRIRFLLPDVASRDGRGVTLPRAGLPRRGARRPHPRALPARARRPRAAAPSRRHGPPSRLAGRAGARRPYTGPGRFELGPGRGHRAAGRAGLVRPRRRRRGAPLADRRGAAGWRCSPCPRCSSTPSTRRTSSASGASVTSTRSSTSRAGSTSSGTSTTVSRSPCCSA